MINKIDEDLKLALKNQDKFTLSVLRMLKSEFINESRKGALHELSDDEAIKVIKRQVKIRKDSIEEYTNYGKTELAHDLEKEVEVLSKYLPEEMSEADILKVIDEVFDELKPESMKDMAGVMKAITSKITNADMAFISKNVRDRLNK